MFSMKDHIVNNFVVIVKKIVIDNMKTNGHVWVLKKTLFIKAGSMLDLACGQELQPLS